jgi:hypothetical protein
LGPVPFPPVVKAPAAAADALQLPSSIFTYYLIAESFFAIYNDFSGLGPIARQKAFLDE